MFGQYNNIAIKAISTVVPESIIYNKDYAEVLGEKRVKKHIEMTGVRERHIMSDVQKTSDLAVRAAEEVLNHTGYERDSIRVLIYVTQVPEYDKPATAFILQKRLQLGKDCIVFDVNLGCSGFVAGMQIIAGLLHNAGGRGLLLLSNAQKEEQRESLVDEMLFGDAACAILVETEDGNPIMYRQQSDGTRFEVIHKGKNDATYMDGAAVFAFTINDVADSIPETKKMFGLQEEDIDYYVFHQGQKMILANLVDICKLPVDKVLYSIEKFGNTEGVSIPLTLCSNRERLREKKEVKLFMSGFGIGLSWGSIYTSVATDSILPIQTI